MATRQPGHRRKVSLNLDIDLIEWLETQAEAEAGSTSQIARRILRAAKNAQYRDATTDADVEQG